MIKLKDQIKIQSLENHIQKVKVELVHKAYLSGWEIEHYQKLLDELTKKLEAIK